MVKTRTKPLMRAVSRLNSVDKWAVQCGRCFKWRSIETQKEFEVIRCNFAEDPFYCKKKTGVSCEDPADIEYNTSRTWVIDKPNLPRTPACFRRDVVMRRDYSKVDVYYVTPNGKRLRSVTDAAQFLKENPQYSHLSVADFSFTSPKVMEDTIPERVETKGSPVKGPCFSL